MNIVLPANSVSSNLLLPASPPSASLAFNVTYGPDYSPLDYSPVDYYT